jgi:hypothetical protein
MRVDLGGGHVPVPEQLLNGADVLAVFQQVCGERVAEGVGARPFRDPGLADGILHRALEHGLVQVVPAPQM